MGTFIEGLIKKSLPIIYVSEHPSTPRMIPAILELTRQRTAVVADSVLYPLLNLITPVVGVDMRGKKNLRLTQKVGNVICSPFHTQDKFGLKGEGIIKRILEELINNRNNILICPSGSSKRGAPWKYGVAYLVERIKSSAKEDEIELAFLFFPHNFTRRARVFYEGSVAEILNQQPYLETKEDIITFLWERFNERRKEIFQTETVGLPGLEPGTFAM